MTSNTSLQSIACNGGLVGGPFGSSLVRNDYTSHGVPVIRGANMGDREISGEFAYISEQKFRTELSRNSARPGDLVFTQRGTLGQVSRVPDSPFETYVISQSQMRLRVNREIADPNFVLYACHTSEFISQIEASSISTGVPHINLGILGALSIPLPSLPEQRAIAEVLGALDDKIAANRKLVSTLDKLMVALVTELEGEGTLAELASLRKNTVQPPAMSRTVSHYSLPRFDEGALPAQEPSQSIKSGKFAFDHPAVLLAKLNPQFPRIWNVPSPEPNAVASSEFLVLEPKTMSTAALWALLSTPRVSNYLQEHVSGTTGSHQRFQPAQAMAMPMPGSIPARLEEALTSLGDRAVAARYESQTLAELRDTLLPALMDGTIRVKDAEKQAEEVL